MSRKERADFQSVLDENSRLQASIPFATKKPKPLTRAEIEAIMAASKDPSLPIPVWYGRVSIATNVLLPYGDCVFLGCTNGVSHSRDNPKTPSEAGIGKPYRTKREALIAIRIEAAERFFKRLAAIDNTISSF